MMSISAASQRKEHVITGSNCCQISHDLIWNNMINTPASNLLCIKLCKSSCMSTIIINVRMLIINFNNGMMMTFISRKRAGECLHY